MDNYQWKIQGLKTNKIRSYLWWIMNTVPWTTMEVWTHTHSPMHSYPWQYANETSCPACFTPMERAMVPIVQAVWTPKSTCCETNTKLLSLPGTGLRFLSCYEHNRSHSPTSANSHITWTRWLYHATGNYCQNGNHSSDFECECLLQQDTV